MVCCPACLTDGKQAHQRHGSWIMGKYLLGWILGVPVIVLVIIYILFN